MKWISKQEAVVDQTSKYSSNYSRKTESIRSSQRRARAKRKNSVVDSDKIRAFMAVSGFLTRERTARVLKIPVSTVSYILYDGGRLPASALRIVNGRLKKEGIKIKERKINFN